QRPVMAKDGSCEPFDVVRDEEHIDKSPAIDYSTRNEPGSRNCACDPDRLRMPGSPFVPVAAQQRKACQREGRQKHNNWTFREPPYSQAGIESVAPPAAARR